MKLLRETIRRLILESACDKTNSKISQAIEELAVHNLKVQWHKSSDDFQIKIIPVGTLRPVAILAASSTGYSQCHSAFIVGHSEVLHPYKGKTGLGALIYDIAVELAGDKGLASDREFVSNDAVGMWQYFFSSGDYDKKPFDNEDGDFTPNDPTDDCEAKSYLEHGGEYGDEQEYFQSHPLNNVYYKKDQSQPTIACLKARGLFQIPAYTPERKRAAR